MKIAFSNSLSQAPCTPSANGKSEAEVQQLVDKLLQRTGLAGNVANRRPDGTLEVSGAPGPKLHTLMLDAEKLGLNIRYTKQTVIEIC